jgi:spermidine synthase
MFYKTTKVERSFTISIGDLIFQVKNNLLLVCDENGNLLKTPIYLEELQTLLEFCERSKHILSPIPGYVITYVNDSGPQKLTLLKDEKNNYTLLINQQMQFTTQSEEIYHEALVGPAVCSLDHFPKKFLILGGGDGLVAKQVYKENPSAEILLVDFDPNMLQLFKDDPVMQEFNEGSLLKCDILCQDAFQFVKNKELFEKKFDVIICDFPDPDDLIFNKLYSLEFYNNVKYLLSEGGVLAVQSGSLVKESKSFKCIANTIKSAGFNIKTFYTPSSYGELVYSIGRLDKIPTPNFSKSLRKYNTLSQEFFEKAMSIFRPGSYAEGEVDINTVDNCAAYEYRVEELKMEGT